MSSTFIHRLRWFATVCIVTAGMFLFVQQVDAATLSLSPGTGVYTAGQTFTARVVVDTSGQKINAAEGTLNFKSNELSVVSIAKGSIFNLWTAEPEFSNTAGTINFSGGTPSGYSGSSGTVLSVTFRTKGAGSSKVSFASGAVLAADGRGTNVLTNMNGGAYTIAAKEVVPEPEQIIEYVPPANTPAVPNVQSSTHGDPMQWYTQKTAELTWDLPADVVAVRTLLDAHSGTIPTKVYNTPISNITLEDLDEGVQYFHIQFKNADGWGRVKHYRLAVDSHDPSAFEIMLPEGADLSNTTQTLQLLVKDETSPVTQYLVQVDGAEPYEYTDEAASSTLTLSVLQPGHHSVIIEAFDAAGNSRIATFSFSILAFDKPQFTKYPSEIAGDVIPVIKGITRPSSKVTLYVQKLGADIQEYSIQSSNTGEFVHIPDTTFALGVYEFTAVAIDQYGAQSELSDPIRIAVQQPGYIRIGSVALSVLSVVMPLLGLLTLLVFGFMFIVQRLRVLRAGVTRESKEALVVARDEFAQLRAVLETHVTTLTKSRKTKKLTKAETSLVLAMREELEDSEKRVAKEIIDVENIVT